MPITLTPLRYPGGKTAYSGLLLDVIRLNGLKNVTLVEPYAGGAGASIKLLLEGRVKHIVLNDLDPSIYAFWWSVVNCPNELISLIHSCDISINSWRRQKMVFLSGDTSDLLKLGFATFYLNRCNRSGILGANPIGGLSQNGRYKIDARFNKAALIKKISDIAQRANDISVRNVRCEDLIQLLSKEEDVSQLLVYFDPPYYKKGPCLYLNAYSDADHLYLSRLIKSAPFRWVLSYDCEDRIRAFYKGLPQYVGSLRYTIQGNQKAKELIISNLKLPKKYSHLID